ncbi:MAG: thiamine phosphate synthase [Acidobacteriia bacterium]|nr:thiamine phosphate synthase [Terriglobia bacterium]
MLLYYITDRHQFPGCEGDRRRMLLKTISEAARYGVDYIQLREKDLSARELLRLAEEARKIIAEVAGSALAAHNWQRGTRLLINSRIDIALAAGADGVHLRSDDIPAAEARIVWSKASAGRNSQLATHNFLIACSCHTVEDVRRAETDGADFSVFAPVFEKGGQPGVGLGALRAACCGAPQANTPGASPAVRIPVLALGGVTLENARACIAAGAAGIAAIRLFQENDVEEVVARLRNINRSDQPGEL